MVKAYKLAIFKMENKIPKLILIDLDGTLADSMGALYQVYNNFLSAYSLQGSMGEFKKLVGPPIMEVVETLKENYAIQDDVKILHQKYVELIKYHLEKVPLMHGAKEFIERSFEKNIRFYIVTSASRSYTLRFIHSHKLEKYFEGVVAFEDVMKNKPDPMPYLTALERANINASSAIAIEDSAMGIASATGAGLNTFWLAPHGAENILTMEWKERICKVQSWPLIQEFLYG